MKAVVFEEFGQPLSIQEVPNPVAPDDGVVIRVQATGICRSDWHGWMGHDSDVRLPHVPGHEVAGIVADKGKDVRHWNAGDRVTLPFAAGCGGCPQCTSGNQQICDNYFQPGFTAWGSFAQYVAIRYADANLVRLPEQIEFVDAAILGCRFATSFRAVVDQGRVRPGEWVAVHGCGGVGLSAVMIACAMGAHVVGIDVRDEALALAQKLGASHTVNSATSANLAEQLLDITQGGAHVSIDALGSRETCRNSIGSLRKRGRHVQIGLMVAENAEALIPMNQVMSKELEIYGSHGMQAHRYGSLLAMIHSGKLQPRKLVRNTVALEEAVLALPAMGDFASTGVTVITRF